MPLEQVSLAHGQVHTRLSNKICVQCVVLGRHLAPQELARRGVGREHVSAALQQVFGEEGLQVGTHIEDLSAPSPSPSQLNGSNGSAAGAGPSSSASATASASLSWGSDSSAEDAAGALLAVARRQFEQSRGLPMEARRRRLVGWLQRRGHRCGDGLGLQPCPGGAGSELHVGASAP